MFGINSDVPDLSQEEKFDILFDIYKEDIEQHLYAKEVEDLENEFNLDLN